MSGRGRPPNQSGIHHIIKEIEMTSPTWLATMTHRAAPVALACGVLVGGSATQAATFQWSPGNQSILLETKALRQTVTGVTVRARGYTVEYTASTAKVFGPYPTGSGCQGLKIFGVDVRRLGTQAAEDLGLISQKLTGIAPGGFDCKNGVSPGFDNKPYKSPLPNTITKIDVALFEFSQAIKVNSVKVDQVSNFGRQIWVAACSAAPSFANGLKAALAACTVRNKNDTPGGATFTHQLGLTGVRYLAVGARPDSTRPNSNALAPITAGNKNADFFIEAIDFTK
jgi:hypothetical protein